MNTAATLRQAPSSDSVARTGRGFRGGFRLASGVKLVFGTNASFEADVREMSPQHLVVAFPKGKPVALESRMSGVLRAQGRADIAVELRLAGANLRDRADDRGFEIVAPTEGQAQAILTLGNNLIEAGLATGPIGRAANRESLAGTRKLEVLQALAKHGALGAIRADGKIVARAVLLNAEEDAMTFSIDASVSGKFRVELPGYNSLYTFDVESTSSGTGTIVTTIPARIQRLRNRHDRRVGAPTASFVEFAHPLFLGKSVRRPIRDLSDGGISIPSSLAEDLLFPELFLNDVIVTTSDKRIRFSAEIRHANDGLCGMRLLPETASDEESWQALVDRQLYPTTDVGSRWAKETWRLYERAGYFGLSDKNASRFNELEEAFGSVSRRIDQAPHLGCQAVWPNEDGELAAAMSMMKIYSPSWLVFQLAKITGETVDGASSREVLRELHLRCFEHANRDPNLKWIVGIPQVKPIWSRAVHYDMPIRYVESGRASITRFRAVEIPVGAAVSSSPSLEIGEASPHERQLTIDEIARTRPTPYVEALDLTAERFDLADVQAEWESGGFRRDRHVLIARRCGTPIAAAVLESADDGVHLFKLLDTTRLFSLADGGEEAFGALLAKAGEWYGEMNKPSFIAFLEENTDIPADAPEGSEDLGLADFVVLSADLLPELLEQVHEVTAPRERAS